MNFKYVLSILSVAFIALGFSSLSPDASKEAKTLKEAMKGKFHIGAAISVDQIWERDTANAGIVKRNFDAIVAENCMKSMFLQPREGEFNFQDADKFVEFGEKNKMWITGHCLIWHSQLPRWFCVDENGANVSPEVLKARMKSHISTVVGRYKGRINGWDVVNEAILEDGSYRKSKFYEILGEEFIPLAFQYAQEADPNVELYYNDYNEWFPGRCATVVKLIKTLKSRGIRIDAIGMQGHLGMDDPSIADYEKAIQAYTKEGVKVMVTEFDLSILPSPRPGVGADVATNIEYQKELNPYTEGVPAEAMQAWNKRMLDLFGLFLKYQDKVSRVTMWGVTDGGSWKNGFPVRGRTDYPLLFDRNYKAKPVVQEIIKLAEKSR
jgi:endo-1,4-beta-xylanase